MRFWDRIAFFVLYKTVHPLCPSLCATAKAKGGTVRGCRKRRRKSDYFILSGNGPLDFLFSITLNRFHGLSQDRTDAEISAAVDSMTF
jgi:hypothetical protein